LALSLAQPLRRSEAGTGQLHEARLVLHLRWEHVDFERGLLLLPDSKTGKKAIVLNAPALDVLVNLPRLGAYVIAGQSAGTEEERPRHDLKRPWQAVAKRAGLEGVRIHDLRHTHASVGAGAGLGLPIIGKLLGHAQTSTTARYAHPGRGPAAPCVRPHWQSHCRGHG
jgi:integrase